MVEPEVCDRLRTALSDMAVPPGPDEAEAALAEVLAAQVRRYSPGGVITAPTAG